MVLQSGAESCGSGCANTCRKKHGIDLDTPRERARDVLHMLQSDLALEWPVPRAPNVFHVGPLLPGPAKPLPQDLEVRS